MSTLADLYFPIVIKSLDPDATDATRMVIVSVRLVVRECAPRHSVTRFQHAEKKSGNYRLIHQTSQIN